MDKIATVLNSIADIGIPRFIGDVSENSVCPLITFFDASIKCYDAAVYLYVSKTVKISISLFCLPVKASNLYNETLKQAVKSITALSRVELLALVIGMRAKLL